MRDEKSISQAERKVKRKMIVKAEFIKLLDFAGLKKAYKDEVDENLKVVNAWIKILQELPIDEESEEV